MATQTPYNPQTDWRGCFGARIVPLDTITNPDMNGIMVGLASESWSPAGASPGLLTDRFQLCSSISICVGFRIRLHPAMGEKLIVASCAGMHMVLSPADVEAGVIATLTQLYSILLSTLLSLGRQQLSLFDANYALTLTSSPFAIYLVYSSICNLFGFETHLFKSTESHRRFIGFFGALLLPIWVGLRLTLWFSTKAFKDSELCKNSSFGDFLLDLLLFFAPLTGPVGGVWFILLCLILASLLAIIGGWIIMVVGQYGDPRPDPWEWLSSLWTIFYNAWYFSTLMGAWPAKSDVL